MPDSPVNTFRDRKIFAGLAVGGNAATRLAACALGVLMARAGVA